MPSESSQIQQRDRAPDYKSMRPLGAHIHRNDGAVVECDLCHEEKPLDEVLIRQWEPVPKALALGFKKPDILCISCAGGRHRATAEGEKQQP